MSELRCAEGERESEKEDEPRTHKVGSARKVAKKDGHAVEEKLVPRVELHTSMSQLWLGGSAQLSGRRRRTRTPAAACIRPGRPCSSRYPLMLSKSA